MSDQTSKHTEEVTAEPTTGKLNEPASEPDELDDKDLDHVSGGKMRQNPR